MSLFKWVSEVFEKRFLVPDVCDRASDGFNDDQMNPEFNRK